MERTNFRNLLPVSRRAVVDFLIEQKKWPLLKEFISAESPEVQQAFKVFMKSVDKSGAIVDDEDNDPVPRKRFKSDDQASTRSPQLPSKETSAVELLQLEVVNEKDNAKKKNTTDESKFTISDIVDLHTAVRHGNVELAQSLIDKQVDINGKEGMHIVKKLSAETDRINDVIQTWNDVGQEVVNPAFQSNDDSVDPPVSIFRLGKNISDLHPLNQGGEGGVYTAIITDLGKVCVKIFYTFDENSSKEAKKLLSLSGQHLNFLKVFGTYEGFNPHVPILRQHGYVMELMSGGTLDDAIYSDHRYEPAQAYFWMLQIVFGVVYLHMKEIAHLDLKPLNLLLDSTRTCLKIADFGHSKNLKLSELTARRATYMYMAPELFAENDRNTLDMRQCDIYSIGITFWEILYRQSPFNKKWTVAKLCGKVTEGLRPCMDNFIWDPKIQEVIEMSWQENPSERCLMDFVVALQQAMEKIPDNPFSTQRLYTLYWSTKIEYFLNVILVHLMTRHETVRAYYRKALYYIGKSEKFIDRIGSVAQR